MLDSAKLIELEPAMSCTRHAAITLVYLYAGGNCLAASPMGTGLLWLKRAWPYLGVARCSDDLTSA